MTPLPEENAKGFRDYVWILSMHTRHYTTIIITSAVKVQFTKTIYSVSSEKYGHEISLLTFKQLKVGQEYLWPILLRLFHECTPSITMG